MLIVFLKQVMDGRKALLLNSKVHTFNFPKVGALTMLIPTIVVQIAECKDHVGLGKFGI